MKTLEEYRGLVNRRLEEIFANRGERPELLNAAMWYSVQAGGKRLRPCMLLAAVDMLHGDIAEALDFACAVEMIHTYSLIHDDLPGMDDDCLRRGRPTNHVVYGVGQAILAGDGLLNMAFEIMLNKSAENPNHAERYIRAIGEIAKGSGVTGMVAGQCLDLDSEKNNLQDADILEKIQYGKTTCMFRHPLRAAACLAGATAEQSDALSEFGRAYGLLFQAADDLMDVIGDTSDAGKTLGKDAASGKLTCVSMYGVDGTRRRVQSLHDAAISALSIFGEDAALLRTLTDKAAMIRGTY